MNRLWLGLGSVLVLIAIGAYFWLRQAPQPPQAQVAAPPPIAPPATTAPAEPAIRHPIEAPPGTTELPPLERADGFVRERIAELLGAKAVNTFIRIEGFVRRAVATLDNLSRPLAPPRMWPIRTTPGRFSVDRAGGGQVIGAKNAARYAPFVALVESVDAARAVALYRRLYPLFQRAYEELGYPGKYFNDRVVAVIDLLLATPEPPGPLGVELPEIEGPRKPTRPWVLYRFSDPTLEKLSSGQKILLRVGRENEKRLKAKLAEIRKLIAVEKAAR
ncbi:MAG: DUF3014 domain-containing protein [Betaproteobacteria bacterium]|nr:DUF3014 domain-containing protein [Betaproteobacteria bacterium]MBI2958849.1 DUF3014 domain-containing protein [Betaproteobacteria bacterium]